MDKKLTIVVPPQNTGWILDTIAQKIMLAHEGECQIVYRYDMLPVSDMIFAMHYTILPFIFNMNQGIKNVGVFFTHESQPIEKVKYYLNKCVSIIVPNDREFIKLTKNGVTNPNIVIVPECDDPNYWKPHRRTEQPILMSGAYYERKNPALMLEVIKRMPDRKFTLLGKDWERCALFEEFRKCRNFEYVSKAPYDNYQAIYDKHDVFFSASTMEGGGPHSLIEAMMCNLVPVVSMTGNYREYITPGYNGFYFNHDFAVSQITEMIEFAYTLDIEVFKTVGSFTWTSFGKEILESLFPNPILEEESASIS
jgi:glycosyltransferase involved in cell wall biosynthesis